MTANSLTLAQKYKYYERSVQNVQSDIDFLTKEFRRIRGRRPFHLREDFGGTGKLACEWARKSKEHLSWAVDLDSEPIGYGKENHLTSLPKAAREQVSYVHGNVLEDQSDVPATDITVAFNFSYFIFKERKLLVDYFTQVRSNLKDDGLFFIDLFGGTECRDSLEEETDHGDFSYYWDCDSYNPITNECQYYIHFEIDGVKHREVFSYDWRMWTIPELREIMAEAGFSKSFAFWEGEDGDGGGNGEFYPSEKEDNCESWVTYICAVK